MVRFLVSLLLPILSLTAGAGVVSAQTRPQTAPFSFMHFLAETLLSPGAVNEKHADLACTDCHVLFRGVQTESCMMSGCHPQADLKKGDQRAVTLHEKAAFSNCVACHKEHRGRMASVTVAFHRSAPPAAQRDCASCHGTEAKDAHPEIKDTNCVVCHVSTASWESIRVDHERLADKQDCAACHDRQGVRAHADIKEKDCTVCHKSTESWKIVEFTHKDQQGKTCAECHQAPKDKLHGAMGADTVNKMCADCHEVVRWRPANFRHDVLARSAVQRCTDCHRSPQDSLHRSAGGISCQRCHSTRAWAPTTFRHPRFPAYGEHMEHLACVDCHPRSLSQTVSCRECHRRGGFEGD